MIPHVTNISESAEQEFFLEFLNQPMVFCSQFEDGQWYCYILLVLFVFALPVGIVGNAAALINYACFRKTSSSSSMFLFNLALCDSAWILTIPFTIYYNLQRPYPTDIQIFCQFKKVIFNVNIYGSIFFLTLISFDRYVGTVHPISSLRWWDVGKAKSCCACAWIVLCLGSVPDLFVTFAIRRPGNITVCMDHIQGPFAHVKTITILRTGVGFVLPFSIMVGFYAMTLRVLKRLPRFRGSKGSRCDGVKPTRLITAALVVFVVSFMPYHGMVIALVFMRLRGQVTAANASVLYASYEFLEAVCSVSCCLDPVLYIMASERFQRKLKALRRGHYSRLCCRASGRVGVIV